MKKLLLPISIFIDILSIIIMSIYLFETRNNSDTIFTVIYILFFVVHIIDKVRKEKMKQGLEKYKLSKNSDFYYYIGLILIFAYDTFLIIQMYNGSYNIDNLIVLVLFYFICLLNYDLNYIYYNKKIALYGSRKIDLIGIEKMGVTRRFFSTGLEIYYKKQNSIGIRGLNNKNLFEIKEFLDKRKKK
ncbi:hypothetical protein [Oceanivirga salmonicida]|uniref:hypothetical protein n=1 Tax=Oceanivirga salmonicida TaxID=1769291 RepID=UPI0012E2AE43|nr:hypothetical protein [Oceanivirga salmonicida]